MTTVRLCKECGAPLPVDAPEGLCPKCLMKQGLVPTENAGPPSPGTEPRTSNVEHPTSNEASDTTTVSDARRQQIGNQLIRYFGDYELLEEIARGGMGVVYKARQVSLNRIVAVKMILAGELAGEAEVKRFHTEAEAAANLQHPNIVAIHEVGEHQGQHYFSMDYVDGVNLAVITRGKPVAAVRAAGYVKAIAEAIHYAHQRGTLHRDLKPQNVLVDSDDRVRITDFGLAKRLERDSGLTQSGAVMGSPSYMSPEQAAGRLDQVGPASDVYSLGAILYYLLTGRPPFVAQTPTATMVKVLQDEPAAPRQSNPAVPVDLETICLKCLEKRPERRYHSARELAEEINRFINQESILARPASVMRKSWIWMLKHPWVITGAATMVVLCLVTLASGFWQRTQYLEWKLTHIGSTNSYKGNLNLSPSSPVLSWILIFLFIGTPMLWLNIHARRKMGLPLHKLRAKLYAVFGGVQIVANLSIALKIIKEHAWERSMLEQTVSALVFFGFLGSWAGAMLIWEVIKELRASNIGEASELRRNLLPELKRDEARFYLVIILIGVAACFVPLYYVDKAQVDLRICFSALFLLSTAPPVIANLCKRGHLPLAVLIPGVAVFYSPPLACAFWLVGLPLNIVAWLGGLAAGVAFVKHAKFGRKSIEGCRGS